MSTSAIFLALMILGTFFLGCYDVLVKKILRHDIHEVPFAGITLTLLGIILSTISFFIGFPYIGRDFWPALASTVILNIILQVTMFAAVKREDASLVAPARLITPPLVILTGWVILGEKISFYGSVGVFTTIVGLYALLQSEAKFTSIRVKDVLKRAGVQFAIASAALSAFSIPFDKKAVVASDAIFFSGMAFLFIGPAILVFAAITKTLTKEFFGHFKRAGPLVFVMLAAQSIGTVMTNQALTYSLAAYAASAKRLWTLWTIVLSGAFLKEKNIGRKLFAAVIMVAGIALTLVYD